MLTRSETLLVVDDEPMNRDLLSRRLERSGYQVAVAENGEQALRLIHSQAFDLVLLDNQLKRFGCGFGQGFYFYRPLDARAAERLLADRNEERDA